MNLGDTRVVLRVRTVSEVLDLAFRFLARDTRTYLKASLPTLLPVLGLCAAARWIGHWSWGAVWAIAISLGMVVQGAFTVVAGRLLFEERPKVRPLLAKFARRLPSYFVMLIVTRVLIAVATLATIPGLFVWQRVAFTHEANLLEDAGPFASLSRSSRFVKRQEMSALGLLVLMLLAQLGFVAVAEALGWGIVEFTLQLGQPAGSLRGDGGSLYALAGFLASVPYVATARFLKYIDIRTRKEGWDIVLRFRAIQQADEAARSGRGSRRVA